MCVLASLTQVNTFPSHQKSSLIPRLNHLSWKSPSFIYIFINVRYHLSAFFFIPIYSPFYLNCVHPFVIFLFPVCLLDFFHLNGKVSSSSSSSCSHRSMEKEKDGQKPVGRKLCVCTVAKKSGRICMVFHRLNSYLFHSLLLSHNLPLSFAHGTFFSHNEDTVN